MSGQLSLEVRNSHGSLQCRSHDFVLACSVLPGNQPSAAPLVDLGEQTGTSFSWTVNIAAGTMSHGSASHSLLLTLSAGTSIGFTLRDGTGAIAQTAPVTIQNSSQSSGGRPSSYLISPVA